MKEKHAKGARDLNTKDRQGREVVGSRGWCFIATLRAKTRFGVVYLQTQGNSQHGRVPLGFPCR